MSQLSGIPLVGFFRILCHSWTWIWWNRTKIDTENAYLLYAIIKLCNTNFHVMFVFLSILNSNQDRSRTKKITEEVEHIVDSAEEAGGAIWIILLGNFNGHIGLLGYQMQNESGHIVVKLMDSCGLTLLNLDACQGAYQYTWLRCDQRSAIDLVFATIFSEAHRWWEKENFEIFLPQCGNSWI